MRLLTGSESSAPLLPRYSGIRITSSAEPKRYQVCEVFKEKKNDNTLSADNTTITSCDQLIT
jgi:hypothetical protein